MIEFDEVSKVFGPSVGRARGEAIALREVTLAVPRGEVWAVVGPNGAGKTTLLGLLLGFLAPSAGRVRIGGEPPRRYLRRHGAAYLPERFRLPDEWRVSAALGALARLEGHDAATARRRVAEVSERLGLDTHAAKPIGTLSRGLMQRVGLAQALLADRELVVLDEPTEGLDPLWRVRFREVVDDLRADGRTVLIASHDLTELERLTDRAIVLEAGEVRRILEVGGEPGPERRYRLELAEPFPALETFFPGASEMDGGDASEAGDGGASEAGEGRVRHTVTVADEAELNDRLAALLGAGGRVRALHPVTEALEDQVRRALAGGES